MASIDKIYGNREQRAAFLAWCKEQLPQACEYFYNEWQDDQEHPITSFPKEIDREILAFHRRSLADCGLEWVVDRIREQYNVD